MGVEAMRDTIKPRGFVALERESDLFNFCIRGGQKHHSCLIFIYHMSRQGEGPILGAVGQAPP